MTRSTVLAFAAGAAGVAGAWEALAAVERARAGVWLGSAVRAVRRAEGEGRAPTDSERRRLAIVTAGCLFAAGWLLAGPLLGLGAAIAGPAASMAVIRAGRRRYRAALAAGAAPAARALAASLAAGRSVRGAVAEASRGVAGPAGVELRRTALALDAGEPTEAALEALRARAASAPWTTLVAAILLQRDAGGDLAGLLRDLASALDAAERTERDARTATAQARFTAWLVAGLPAAAAVIAELGRPGFIGGLLANPLSATLTGFAVLAQLAALAAIRQIARGAAA